MHVETDRASWCRGGCCCNIGRLFGWAGVSSSRAAVVGVGESAAAVVAAVVVAGVISVGFVGVGRF